VHNTFIVEYLHWKRPSTPLVDLGNKVLGRFRVPLKLTRPEPGIMGSVELRMNVFHLASEVLANNVPGDFVEVGCNAGFSSVILQRVLRDHHEARALHCFDSFEGLPGTLDIKDLGSYEVGEMKASRQWFEDNFRQVGLELPLVHQGWFEDTLPPSLPDRISYALVDADLYKSTLTALEHVYPRLGKGAVCMFGVYSDPSVYVPRTRSVKYQSPGVKAATDEFLADKPEKVSVLYSGEYSSGYFYKQ
jgi:O-methyltransferase